MNSNSMPKLFARPAHGVVQSERLDRAVGKVPPIGVEGREAPDVHVPQVERRLAADDPLGNEPPGSAGVGDAGRIEARAHEVTGDLGRLSQDEIAAFSGKPLVAELR